MWKPALLLSMTALIVMTVPALLLTVVFAGSDVDSITGTVRYADGDVTLPAGACVEVRRHAVQRCLSGSGGRYRGRNLGRQRQNIASSRRRMRGGSSGRGASR